MLKPSHQNLCVQLLCYNAIEQPAKTAKQSRNNHETELYDCVNPAYLEHSILQRRKWSLTNPVLNFLKIQNWRAAIKHEILSNFTFWFCLYQSIHTFSLYTYAYVKIVFSFHKAHVHYWGDERLRCCQERVQVKKFVHGQAEMVEFCTEKNE